MSRYHRRRIAPLVAALSLAVAAFGCKDLAPLELGICGNFVIEKGEDCDGEPAGARCIAPGEPHECRLTCAEDGLCAPGYGCGIDGICRKLKDPMELAKVREVTFPHAENLQTGDLDGDGWTDVLAIGEEDGLGRRQGRVVYSNPDGDPFVVPAPSLLAAPLLAHFQDSPQSALAYADLQGVSLFEGTPQKTLQLSAFPALVADAGHHMRAIPIDALALPGDEIVLLSGPPRGASELRVSNGSGTEVLTTLPAGEEELSGPIVRARLREDSPCDQLVFTFLGSSEALIVYPCREVAFGVEWNVGGAWSIVGLPQGKTIDGPAVAADLDADGHEDLLLHSEGALYAAYGQGDGAFWSLPGGLGEPAKASAWTALDPLEKLGTTPLVAAHLNDDPLVDFVLPGGVAVSGTIGYVTAYENIGANWSVAVVADFNQDGRLDIAAGTPSLLDVDFLTNAGTAVFNPTFLLSDGPVEHLATGDFNGDLLSDLMVVSTIQEGDEPIAQLSSYVGQSDGPPADPLVVTRFGSVEGIASARLRTTASLDGIADLLVSAEDRLTDTDSIFVMQGSGNRTMIAPFPLRTDGETSLPIALVAAPLHHDLNELIALGMSEAGVLRFFRVEEHDVVELGTAKPSEPLVGPFHSAAEGDALFSYGALLGAGDLDSDGTVEVVLLAPYDEGSALVIVHWDEASFSLVPGAPIALPFVVSNDGNMVVRDVDGDGTLDVAVISRDDDIPGQLFVLRGHGDGSFALPPELVDLGGAVNAITCLSPAENRRCDLFAIGDTGLWRVSPDIQGVLEGTPIEGVAGGTALCAADFDKDGVIDVAIGDDTALHFYRSLPGIE